jgi:hypothetical protein
MTGGLLELAAYGEQNEILNGNPQITFFKTGYKRYTNFALEMIEQDFEGDVNFGKKVYCVFDRKADLIHRIYLYINLPALMTEQEIALNPPIYYSWVNSIGNAIIHNVEIQIGDQIIDKLYGVWLEIWNELTLEDTKIPTYNSLVGKHDYFNATTQPGSLQLNIPLPFWFCKNIGCALPLIAIQHNNIRLNLSLRKFEELVVSTNGTLPVVIPRITECYLWVEYIYLETEERRIFAQSNHQYLIDQLQVNTFDVNPSLNEVNMKLDFNNPVKCFYWYIQNQNVLTMVPGGGNEWFNFSTVGSTSGIYPEDPLNEAKFYIEGNEVTKFLRYEFFRQIFPYQFHTRPPRNYIYMYSFSLEPEKYQPTGALNVSRIDNLNLLMHLKSPWRNGTRSITMFANNYNVLDIQNGFVGVSYAN